MVGMPGLAEAASTDMAPRQEAAEDMARRVGEVTGRHRVIEEVTGPLLVATEGRACGAGEPHLHPATRDPKVHMTGDHRPLALTVLDERRLVRHPLPATIIRPCPLSPRIATTRTTPTEMTFRVQSRLRRFQVSMMAHLPDRLWRWMQQPVARHMPPMVSDSLVSVTAIQTLPACWLCSKEGARARIGT